MPPPRNPARHNKPARRCLIWQSRAFFVIAGASVRADSLYTQTLERRLARLPEYERGEVEAMILELCRIRNIGRGSALDIIYRIGLKIQEATRKD